MCIRDRCMKISLGLLIHVNLYVREGITDFRPSARVWLNGELQYFSKEHFPYALSAIFCLLIMGLLPPALLLTYPLLNKVLTVLSLEDQKVIVFISQKLPISSLKPLLDSIQGCFKDKFRFFAGLYLLYRCTILLTYIAIGSFSTRYIITGGTLLFIIALHAICQPYIRGVHNVIDTLLFTNLVFINSLSFINYYRSRKYEQRDTHHGNTTVSAIVQLVLIYLPVAVMGVYLLLVTCKSGCRHITFFTPKRAHKLKELVQTMSTRNEDTKSIDEELPYRLMTEDETV